MLRNDDEPSQRLLDVLGPRFEFEGLLGRGGMAVVWLARRRSDGEQVAIKVLRSEVASVLGVQRFVREIRIASDVHAGTLVKLEESGEVDGLPYYVMPYANAGSLRQRLTTQGQLPLSEAVGIATDIARALAELHRNGFVHRDIKPENVLLTAQGTGLLADYGIARAITASATEHFTSTGVVIGTPAYMSPEQAAGDTVDARSDQYSWGCLLFEMLAGVAPFHGATSQAVLARHMYEAPPSLHVVRSSVPSALEAIVTRTLAKTPADRFENVEALLAALEQANMSAPWPPTRDARRPWPPRRKVAVAFVVLCGAIAIGTYRYRFQSVLDPSSVVVFPLASLDPSAAPRGGEELAMLIGSALERAEGTRWIEGVPLLDARERQSATGVSDTRARSIARHRGARYYLTGVLSRASDSTAVQVELHDAADGAMVRRETERGVGSAGDLTLRAVVRLLPKLTGLDRVVDVSALAGHPPAAVTDWLLGEREYRQSRMEAAFRHLAMAASADSMLAPAAFRAAAAASWTNQIDTARTLSRLALRHRDALSPAQQHFALALERLIEGRADEAIDAIRPLLRKDRESADAWMLVGEIELHLMPNVLVSPGNATTQVDSFNLHSIPAPTSWPAEARAEQAFERARTLDPSYTPPLAHLAEIAARRGDVRSLSRLVQLRAGTPSADEDSVFAHRMAITQRCLERGTDGVDWRAEAKRSAIGVFYVGGALEGAADNRARRCAIAAFEAVLAADTIRGPSDWGALVGLHAMLVAQGSDRAATRLLDSAVASGMTAALGLELLDVAVGFPSGPAAKDFASRLFDHLDTRPAPSLWLLSVWSASTNDVNRLERIHAAAETRLRTSGQRLDSLIERVTAAYLLVSRGDTLRALSRFAELRPTGSSQDVETSLWESLAAERLEYARLLLAHGDAAAAHRVGSTFDSPTVMIHQLFLPASLNVRLQAARALGDTALERQARGRLLMLARTSRQH